MLLCIVFGMVEDDMAEEVVFVLAQELLYMLSVAGFLELQF